MMNQSTVLEPLFQLLLPLQQQLLPNKLNIIRHLRIYYIFQLIAAVVIATAAASGVIAAASAEEEKEY